MSHGTVTSHIEAGTITPRKRVTVDDLEFAATWLEAFEGDPDQDKPELIALATVAASLRRDAARRRERSSK